MATKDKNNTKKKDSKRKKKDKERKGAAKELAETKQDFTDAEGLATDLGFTPTLDRTDTSGYEAAVKTAGQRSDEMKEVLGIMKGGLAGLNAVENQSLREQAQREVDRSYQNEQYALQKMSGGGKLRGGALASSLADISSRRQGAQSNLEQDLLVKNIDIQDQRRRDYSSLLGGQEESEFGRGRSARNDLLNAQGFNASQQGKELGARMASITGIANYGESKRSGKRSYRLAKEGMKKGIGVSNSASTGTNSNQALIDAVSKLGQDYVGISPEEIP